MNQKYKLLTIGQFAALHKLNKKTLMWYDEIDLFKPFYINPDNGYRFYSYQQSSILETILLLRELDVSIAKIQTFMKNRSAASLKVLLDQKIMELDENIKYLKAVRKTMCNYRQNMQTLMAIDLDEISIVRKERRCLVTVDISKESSFDKQVEMIIKETEKYQLRRLHDASYGTMILVDELYDGNYDSYSKLFIEIPFPIKKTGLHVQPQGKYLRAFYQGAWEGMPQKYQEILAFAQKSGLTLSGYSYEMGINESVIDRMEDYITQIEIPIRE